MSSERVDRIIAFARKNWRDEGAEGEAVHALCDELDAFRAALVQAREIQDHLRANEAKARTEAFEECAKICDSVANVLYAQYTRDDTNAATGAQRCADEIREKASKR